MTFFHRVHSIFNKITNKTLEYKVIKKSLPKVPVPDLEKTLNRYLEYASVVADGQNKSIAQTAKAVEDFKITGRPVQKKLEEIAAKETNWVNRYWLPEMYHRIRLPLPVNSSPAYVFPQQSFNSKDDQLRYSSLLIRGLLEYKDRIDKRLIERELSTGPTKQSICMMQYDRVLGCYRHPMKDEDIQIIREKNHKGNEHIVVMTNNQTFVIRTRVNGQLKSASSILKQLEEAERMSRNRGKDMVIPIAASSCGDRNDAAQCWNELLKVDENKQSLSIMQRALFIVCIDEADNNNTINSKDTDSYTEEMLVERGHHLLTGGGSKKYGLNRWYDCSIQVVIRSDGLSGLCIEHSAAEGIVIIQMAESALNFVKKMKDNKLIWSENGSTIEGSKGLTWVVSEEARRLMDKQIEQFDELHNEMELEALIFDDFGKEAIKNMKVSPDGFIQLAMQLAHYRLHGYLVSTYESASIRRFAEGRVDNIRAATPEAYQWVKSMVKADLPKYWPSMISYDWVRQIRNVTMEERVHLFRAAATKQAIITAENINGFGIDNHLCALACISSTMKLDNHPLFIDPLWNETMRFPLSTSQVTTSPEHNGSYLCYGAVVRDGYGCAYNIMSNRIIFAPSAFKSNERTKLKAFKYAIRDSLLEMKSLLQ